MNEDRLQEYLIRKSRKRLEEDWGENFRRTVPGLTLAALISWLIYGYEHPTTYLLFIDALTGGLFGLAWFYEWNWRRQQSN